MKRLILTTIICFMVCLSIPINSFASGVGGALGGIGSGIDPRTDSRYKDKFQLDASSDADKYFIDNNARYGDVIFTYFQNVDAGGEIKQVVLKCYFRIWYIPSEYNNPCFYLNKNANGFGNLQLRYLSSEGKPLSFSRGTERYDGLFDTYHGTTLSNITSQNYFTNSSQIGEILYSDFPVFSNITDCDFYCSTNQVRNAVFDSSIKDYSSELYFKSFDVIPHVSNRIDAFCFDVKYELSDYAKRNINNLNLNFESQYLYNLSALEGLTKLHKTTRWWANQISLKENPYGFVIYMTDLACYNEAVTHFTGNVFKNALIGENFFVNVLDIISAEELSGLNVVEFSNIVLYFRFNLRFSGSNGVVVGKRNDFTYDFLNKTVEKYIYTPDTSTDSSGNTAFNKDSNGNITYTQEGDKVTSNDYYYNKVTETNEGDTTNVTNNYYYYDKDGKEHEISEDDYNNSSMTVMGGEGGNATAEGGSATANASIGDININISNGSGEYIDISPQSYALYIDAMKTLLEELNPQGGLFLLMHDAYTVFPAPIWVIVGGGLAAAVWVSLVCIARR